MADLPIAAQLYTLRDFAKTPAEIAGMLKKVRQIGYPAVQVAGLGKIDAKELGKMLSGEGLQCCATHISLERMRNEPAAVIEEHRLWNCGQTAIGGFFPENPTFKTWKDFAADFNTITAKYAGSGLMIGYHNHSHELIKFDGKTAMRILMEDLTPTTFFEIDTYWIAHGGGDPAAWIEKMAGRIPSVHLKDMGINVNKQQFMMEVGEGNLNWPAVLQACKKAGVQWYIVEEDECYRDPFESLKISLENLRGMMG